MPVNNLRHGYCRKGKVRPEWQAWNHMIQRCTNTNDSFYADYGGRGISVCEKWASSFDAFICDMGDRPVGHSLDRINASGNYCPENCRWADKFTQAKNRRSVILIEHDGHIRCAQDWSRVTGIPRQTILQRYHKGWESSKILKVNHERSSVAVARFRSVDDAEKRRA